jgi:hypothetical protein
VTVALLSRFVSHVVQIAQLFQAIQLGGHGQQRPNRNQRVPQVVNMTLALLPCVAQAQSG